MLDILKAVAEHGDSSFIKFAVSIPGAWRAQQKATGGIVSQIGRSRQHSRK